MDPGIAAIIAALIGFAGGLIIPPAREWLESFLRSIRVLPAKRLPTESKFWVGEPERQAFDRYLKESRGRAVIRFVSYTGETTSEELRIAVRHFLENQGQGLVDVKVLLRSEYAPFAYRQNQRFSHHLQRRIWLEKSRWYRWIRELESTFRGSDRFGCEVRDYFWDPGLKAVLLGAEKVFWGRYVLTLGEVTGRRDLGKDRDWVARETAMALAERDADWVVTSLDKWFDRMWPEAEARTNETYRFEACDRLWNLVQKKSRTDSTASEWANRMISEGHDHQNTSETPSLILPAESARVRGESVDFILFRRS